MQIQELIQQWNQSLDLDDFSKKINKSQLEPESLQEFRQFLQTRYGEGFEVEKTIQRLMAS